MISHIFCSYCTTVRLYIKAYNEGKDIFLHICKITKSNNLLRHVCLSAWNNLVPLEGFLKFDIWLFFRYPWRRFKFHSKLTRITGTLHEDRYVYIWDNILLNSSQNEKYLIQNYRENQNTYFTFNKVLPEMVHFLRQSGKI